MIAKIEKRIHKAIDDKVFPGCVVGILKKGRKRIVLPFGKFTYEDNSTDVKEDAIYDVASITKSIPTSCLALKLIDEGKLNIEDKLINYVPEFRNSDRENVLIKHLLTQTLTYKANSPDKKFRLSQYKDKTPDEILDIIFSAEFEDKPGENYSYTNSTSILLGLVVERMFDDELNNLAEKYFFEPLKMSRTSFTPLRRFDKSDIVPTEIDDWRDRIVQGEVHDESAYILQKKFIPGHAGLFSTVPDLLNFLEMLLNFGEYQGKKHFSEDIVNEMATNQLVDIGEFAGLGWELDNNERLGKNALVGNIFSKSGFTGCIVYCDLKREVGVVFLSNRIYPRRSLNAVAINEVRRDITNIIFSG